MQHERSQTADPQAVVSALRAGFGTGLSRPVAWRIRQLKALRRMLIERRTDFERALQDDLGKNATEAWLTEVGFTVNEIDHTLRHLRGWLRPRRRRVPLALQPANARTVFEPRGVVLIIAPWNYPLQLLLTPLVGALASGNVVLAKPSELAPATSSAIARWLPEYLDRRAVQVVEGGVAETTAILEQRFDHVFYTGNAAVGQIVMEAAAKHLTPVTLELGGKSPVYVDDSADITVSARRIAWGKFMNAGQTCVAPDYVLASAAVQARLVPALDAAIREMFGDDPTTSPDFGRIINERNYDRLTALLPEHSAIGGQANREARYIAPTVLPDADPSSAAMSAEIFGPILPLVTVDGAEEAVRFINSRDKPLALYLFSNRRDVRKKFVRETSSGGIVIGAPTMHLSVSQLPFGGVGHSGMGSYHGVHSIEAFSHQKAVLTKPLNPDTLRLVYPPFTKFRDTVIRRFIAPDRRK
ncbi:aldehyde dehydrogenase family protein [Saxibacter everestensis]|uniref:Aldehyde dehydrogenase n=1 Tax=Saxibacter everestensis TaxID=2909229 RepID=A0ABY8R166_9MICO|nr:aldehyde dehydrogenase family protein [Brevibacteriaceae bacterium ZFBP1038]